MGYHTPPPEGVVFLTKSALIERARAKKAMALADVIHRAIVVSEGSLTLDDVRIRDTPEFWRLAAAEAKCNPPGSDECREMVIRQLEALQEKHGRNTRLANNSAG